MVSVSVDVIVSVEDVESPPGLPAVDEEDITPVPVPVGEEGTPPVPVPVIPVLQDDGYE